ncbi:anti-phage ZorAB system protein ZorA [Photobacterium sp. 1_MG-2023]|uniref:anti-phage ZorAB system protein ZorA n=1 Tax=Photobacterium sp. 1_MG-2023 TaxID=3062646 RepID=UPI0026E16F25|nr:anti-phage ZorAB system protein ZorA [Photobacterium sp. 1_MG-2023]MDO6705522.1 anti-phage ZorAB system protein ZorA [Photobacterium sp. 1_MG-2023]
MEDSRSFDLSWLFPNFDAITSLNFIPTSGEELSALVVSLLIFISLSFAISYGYRYVEAYKRIHWLRDLLKGINRDNVLKQREYLYQSASEKSGSIGHLWLEFDETLVETRDQAGNDCLRNTLDAGHFFNTHTLAKRVTENRLIAAVPGFLTAVGVIGTFVGLQIGLSGLELGQGVSIEQMKDGVGGVVNGAKVAFLTSVWGIGLSVFFNFGEKWLEQRIRNSIRTLESRIDHIFPRIRPEEQLKTIAEHGEESKEALQVLAEKIGEKMQEAMLSATEGIQTSLEKSLSDIMAPAINKLVDETAEGNQKALEGLLESFMDGFGKEGSEQRAALSQVSGQVNESVASMQTTMNDFVSQLQKSQAESWEREKSMISDISLQVSKLVHQTEDIHQKLSSFVEEQVSGLSEQLDQRAELAARREKELVATIQQQVDELVTNSREQGKVLTQFVESQLSGLTNVMEQREQRANEIEHLRNQKIEDQTNTVSKAVEQMLSSVEHSITRQVATSESLISQGQSLQSSIDTSVEANAKATEAMRESASELRISADQMRVLGSNIKEAGNKLSGAIKEAVDSTQDLASQNQVSSERMEAMRDQLTHDVAQFDQLAQKLSSMLDTAGSTFTELRASQSQYLDELKGHVDTLSNKMAKMLEDYAQQANGQTREHLKVWSESVTQYSEQMTGAVRSINSIVDSIEEKVG